MMSQKSCQDEKLNFKVFSFIDVKIMRMEKEIVKISPNSDLSCVHFILILLKKNHKSTFLSVHG